MRIYGKILLNHNILGKVVHNMTKENTQMNKTNVKVGKKKAEKVGFFSSIRFQILSLLIISLIAISVVSYLSLVPGFQSMFLETTEHYMTDSASLTGHGIDRELALSTWEEIMSPEALGLVAADVKVSELETSYCYVVSADGTMLYHPTADKIGQPVENDAVKALLEGLKAGKRPDPEVIKYDFKGVRKYAAYYIGENSDFIVIVSADEDDVLEEINGFVRKDIIYCISSLLFFVIAGFIIITQFTRPIIQLAGRVQVLANMDFRMDEKVVKLAKRKDETGAIVRAIAHMRGELVKVIENITAQSAEVYQAAQGMNDSSTHIIESVDNVEKAVSEIAQGATSQAQETQTATENIILMGNMIEDTNSQIEELRSSAGDMRSSAQKALEILGELNEINDQTKGAIQVIYDQTNTTNSSAMKIKEATDIITDIAEETNLLSLNASIEAARAGEQGRGFAVVASQIQKLAEQSNESARQIAGIIDELISDSEKSVETMEEVRSVIAKQDEYVANTETSFHEVNQGIEKSIDVVRTIASKTQELDGARVRVVDIVQNLTAIAEENAASTEETSASTVEVSNTMKNMAEEAQRLTHIANDMEDRVKIFVLE